MKLKRLLAISLSLMIAVTLSSVSIATVFAAESGISDDGTEAATSFALTKEFNVGEGITVPDEAFSFTVTPAPAGNPYTGETEYVGDSAKYATLSFAAISFAESDRGDSTPEKLVKESKGTFTGKFGSAGLFVYKVKENVPSPETAGMTYDKTSEYYVKVYVKNGENGPEVAGVGVTDGTEKKDATPQADNPGNNQPVPESKEGTGQFRFVNSYVKEVTKNPETVDGEGNPTAAGAFDLEKLVAGEYGDKTKEFTFNIKVTLPSTAADNYSLAAKANGEDVAFTADASNAKVKTATVSLADSQHLNFATLPAGTKIEFQETKVDHYAQNYEGKHKNPLVAIAAGDANAPDAAALAACTVTVGEKGAYVNYTNTFDKDEVTPTGILINNLPYILLILLAAGGIVVFARKRRYQ